ncbi:hypothetical protein KAZ66_04800 [Candidatus Woesebacteria bacterium]|nr:hypothetical protein [Candidatus Woesebacteria bacterium]
MSTTIHTSFVCPQCGRDLRRTDAICPGCFANVTFTLPQLQTLPGYDLQRRNGKLDEILVNMLYQAASQRNCSLAVALHSDCMLIFVQNQRTFETVSNGYIQSMPLHSQYFLLSPHIYLKIHILVNPGGEKIFFIGHPYSAVYFRVAHEERELQIIPEIMQWVDECVTIANSNTTTFQEE